MKPYKPLIPNFLPVGHQYHDDAGMVLPSVTNILKEELGLYQFSSQTAPVRGTDVHLACHFYDDTDLIESTLTEEVVAYFRQYKLAKQAHNIKVHANELMRYSKKYCVAGTLDKVVTIDNANGILDIKTCKVLKEEAWHKWQTAMYFEFLREEMKAAGLPLTKRWALYLCPDKFKLVEHTGTRDFIEFLALMSARQIRINNSYLKPKQEE